MIAEVTESSPNQQQPQSLAELHELDVAKVVDVRATAADAAKLKSLGLCIGRRVQVVQLGDPLIIRAIGIRLGLSKRLAEQVYVTPLCTGVVISEASNS